VIEKSADVNDAVAKVIAGKSFDYGTLCSSEQAIVAEESLRESILAALKTNKAYLCDAKQSDALGKLLLTPQFTVNADCVGQPAPKIAQMAGFQVPQDTRVLAAEVGGVGKQYPLSAEKLSPVLSLFFVKDFPAALDTAEAILRFGGLGHTCAIYSKDDAKIREFAVRMPAMRILCNTPTPQGSTGITTNLFPAMTLGCGAAAGNSTGDNIGPLNLINIKRLAYEVRKPEEAFDMPAARPAPARAPMSGGSQDVDKQTIISAVERYLAQRGIPMTSAPSEKMSTPAVAEVVDRFLSSKRTAAPAVVPTVAPAATPPPLPEIPDLSVAIVDFVCEYDVRNAINKSQKIYIGPKTIVTPAARDLASQHEILIMAKRR
jgi:acetaldehyde dehydrogenase (acetylating)